MTVEHFLKPQSIYNVCSFLGLAVYYCPFIQNFAAKAIPLTGIIRKESTSHWNATQEIKYSFKLTSVLMQCDEREKNHVIA